MSSSVVLGVACKAWDLTVGLLGIYRFTRYTSRLVECPEIELDYQLHRLRRGVGLSGLDLMSSSKEDFEFLWYVQFRGDQSPDTQICLCDRLTCT